MWQRIDENTPRGKKLIVYGIVCGEMVPRVMMGRYWKKHTYEVAEEHDGEDWVDVDANGIGYMPEGWYEYSEGEEAQAVNIAPTHWQPLPAPPQD